MILGSARNSLFLGAIVFDVSSLKKALFAVYKSPARKGNKNILISAFWQPALRFPRSPCQWLFPRIGLADNAFRRPQYKIVISSKEDLNNLFLILGNDI